MTTSISYKCGYGEENEVSLEHYHKKGMTVIALKTNWQKFCQFSHSFNLVSPQNQIK